MGTTWRRGTSVAGWATWVVGLLVASHVPTIQATPWCVFDAGDQGGCSSSFCRIECSSEMKYLVFGHVVAETAIGSGVWSDKGWGVCIFERINGTCGGDNASSFVNYRATTIPAQQWVVSLNSGDDATGGNDVIRLADGTSGDPEWCYSLGYGRPRVYIYRDIPSGSRYIFDGDGGCDLISLTDGFSALRTEDPGHTPTCAGLPNVAWGGPGDDDIYGSYCPDIIFGEAGDEYPIWGGGGGDSIYAGPGNDGTVQGGSGNDYIYGGSGSDSMWGGAGCDYLYGDDPGGGSSPGDYCSCGDNGGYQDAACETSDGKCIGCS